MLHTRVRTFIALLAPLGGPGGGAGGVASVSAATSLAPKAGVRLSSCPPSPRGSWKSDAVRSQADSARPGLRPPQNAPPPQRSAPLAAAV